MHLWSSKNPREISLVIEIGPGSAGAALVDLSPGNLPCILASNRSTAYFMHEFSAQEIESATLKSLEESLKRVTRNNLEYLWGALDSKSLKVIVTLSSPFGLENGSKKFMNSIEDTILRFIGIKEGIMIEEFIFVMKKILDQSFKDAETSNMVSITNESMDFLITRKGIPLSSKVIPFGPAHIARQIQRDLGLPIEIAYSYLSLFSLGTLDKEIISSLDLSLFKAESEFSQLFDKAKEQDVNMEDLPPLVFLVGPKNYEKIYKTLFESILPKSRVVVIGNDNRFTRELVSQKDAGREDQKLSLLASFSGIVS
jgi:hypothetical protein